MKNEKKMKSLLPSVICMYVPVNRGKNVKLWQRLQEKELFENILFIQSLHILTNYNFTTTKFSFKIKTDLVIKNGIKIMKCSGDEIGMFLNRIRFNFVIFEWLFIFILRREPNVSMILVSF